MKQKYRKLVLWLCLSNLFFVIGCSKNRPSDIQEKIEKQYGLILSFSLSKEMIYANESGYIILRLPASDLIKILKTRIPKFSEWRPYKESMFIGYKKSFRIDGKNNDHYLVAWNDSPTKNKCDKLAIFIDLSHNYLIFYDGIISGY